MHGETLKLDNPTFCNTCKRPVGSKKVSNVENCSAVKSHSKMNSGAVVCEAEHKWNTNPTRTV